MLIFFLIFLPFLLLVSIFGSIAGRKRRVQLLGERAQHDRQRFLGMGFLRYCGRQEEQRSVSAFPQRGVS
jgi:hypothetical protein